MCLCVIRPRCNDVCASSCGRCCIMISPTVIGSYSTSSVLQHSTSAPLSPEAALACTCPVVSMCMHPHAPHVIAALADGRFVLLLLFSLSVLVCIMPPVAIIIHSKSIVYARSSLHPSSTCAACLFSRPDLTAASSLSMQPRQNPSAPCLVSLAFSKWRAMRRDCMPCSSLLHTVS